MATAIRTTVILLITRDVVAFGKHINEIKDFSRHTWFFLILSIIATGLSWLFYFKSIQLGDVSKVAPLDKLSVVFVIIHSIIFLKEELTARTIIGGILIAAGSIVMILR